MIVKVLMEAGIKDLTLAGFDGYSIKHANYYKRDMEYDFAKQKIDYLNKYTKDFLDGVKDRISVKFLTKSHYEG